jgi:hypothetical protein
MASATDDVPQNTMSATTDTSANPRRSGRSGAVGRSSRAVTRRRRPAAQAAARTHSAMAKGITQASSSGTAPPRSRTATARPMENHVPRRAHRPPGRSRSGGHGPPRARGPSRSRGAGPSAGSLPRPAPRPPGTAVPGAGTRPAPAPPPWLLRGGGRGGRGCRTGRRRRTGGGAAGGRPQGRSGEDEQAEALPGTELHGASPKWSVAADRARLPQRTAGPTRRTGL